jgi:hypothetical protein
MRARAAWRIAWGSIRSASTLVRGPTGRGHDPREPEPNREGRADRQPHCMSSRTGCSRLLTALVAGSLATPALAACGGAAPTPVAARPTLTLAPTPVSTPALTVAPTHGPITWDVRHAPGTITGAVSTGALLIAVGTAGFDKEGSETVAAWTSADGRTWDTAAVAQPAGSIAAVASGPGRLVAVGTRFENVNQPVAWTSVDGRTWQALPASAFAGAGGYEPGALEDIAAGPGGFVAVGSEHGPGGGRAAAWYSADGLTWARAQSDLGGDSAGAVVRGGPGYVAAGWAPGGDGDDRAVFWSSPDGQTWTAAPDSQDLHGVGATPMMAGAPQGLVAVGYPSHQWAGITPIVWISQDGLSWQRLSASGLVAPLPSVPSLESGQPLPGSTVVGEMIATGGGLVAAGEAMVVGPGSTSFAPRRVVWLSATGASWSLAAELPALPADPGSVSALVSTLVVHRGRLLVFGRPVDPGPAPLWDTDLQALLAGGGHVTEDAPPTATP